MYDNILVLLDGSQVSEVILRHVPSMFCSSGSQQITLLRVLEGTDEHDNEAAEEYLREKSEYLKNTWNSALCPAPEINVEAIIGSLNNTAHTIAEYAIGNSGDMIMLATRGWSGADWWTTASVAERVIKESAVPVFVVRPVGTRRGRPGMIQRILVPLDGSGLAEQAVPFAERIAASSSASVNLVHVQEQASRQRVAVPVQHDEDDVTAYLERVSARLGDSVRSVATTVNTHGSISQQIADIAEKEGMDLILMGSHGRSGPGQGEFGGITDRVIHASRVPILVIPHHVKIGDD